MARMRTTAAHVDTLQRKGLGAVEDLTRTCPSYVCVPAGDTDNVRRKVSQPENSGVPQVRVPLCSVQANHRRRQKQVCGNEQLKR